MNADRIMVLETAERLDSAAVGDFKSESQQLLADGEALIIDLSHTLFIDSAGLGSLVSLLKTSSQKGIRLALAGLTPQVRQIFELTRLYKLFDIFDSVVQARNALLP